MMYNNSEVCATSRLVVHNKGGLGFPYTSGSSLTVLWHLMASSEGRNVKKNTLTTDARWPSKCSRSSLRVSQCTLRPSEAVRSQVFSG